VAIENIRKVIRLARLTKDEELLQWAWRLVNDLNKILDELLEEVSTAMGGGGVPAAHDILSATHTDSVPATVVRGDLLRGSSAPAWSKLSIGTGVLKSDGTDPSWGTLGKSDLPAAIAYEDESNVFTSEQFFDGFLDLSTIATPANPDVGDMRLYVNKTGITVELRVRAENGAECVLCSKTIVATVQTLPLNLVE